MIETVIKFFYNNSFVSLLFGLVLLVLGLMVAPFEVFPEDWPRFPVSVDALPDIGEHQHIVYVDWGGHSPEEIEDQLNYPLTKALLSLPGLKQVRSHALFGRAAVYLVFDDDLDYYWCRSRILEKLAALPLGTFPSGIIPRLSADATALGQIFWYTLEGRDSLGETTGGWDLHELRSIQDFYIKYQLLSTEGVAEVASVGGFVKSFQIDVDPVALENISLTIAQLFQIIQQSNRDVGARTLEMNRVNYYIRGLGQVRKVKDLEEIVVKKIGSTTILLKDVAKVYLGTDERYGILDKGGAEVVGGVVVARVGANPMEVLNALQKKIKTISKGLPTRVLADGRTTQLNIIPFYDRSEIITESLQTLLHTLAIEIILVFIIVFWMIRRLDIAFCLALLLPLAVLLTFAGLKLFSVTANMVSLAGIAIAIGTMVDIGIVLVGEAERQNVELAEWKNQLLITCQRILPVILVAVATTLCSFIPVFGLEAAEGKLFTPLAVSKTLAISIAFLLVLILLPSLLKLSIQWRKKLIVNKKGWPLGGTVLVLMSMFLMLSFIWHPIGVEASRWKNVFFILLLFGTIVWPIHFFIQNYERILLYAIKYSRLFLLLPFFLLIAGGYIWSNMGRSFLPALEEGEFLLMPSSLPQAGITENREILQLLDQAVATIPEVEMVVGKAGRAETALDPAPLSMFESLVRYKSEYQKNSSGNWVRNWRSHIESPQDIWNEIIGVTSQIPGITIPPKLQPIETRLVMLESGMKAPMGIKIKGQDWAQIESFSFELEAALQGIPGVQSHTVFAERNAQQPYLEIIPDREKITALGFQVNEVLDYIEMALGGKKIGESLEGREAYPIYLRFPRVFRGSPDAIADLQVQSGSGQTSPLGALVEFIYRQGPQVIKGEDGFLVNYLIFDKAPGEDEVQLVSRIQASLDQKQSTGQLKVPETVSYEFAGRYQDQQRAEKRIYLLVGLAFIIILLILYLRFRSWILTALVFFGVLVAFAGGFIALWLYGQDWFLDFYLLGEHCRDIFHMENYHLNVAVWIGFLALFGIATDDGVLMASFLQEYADQYQNPVDAALAAGKARLLPAMMTTSTTLLAIFPILTAMGRGSDLMIPIAIPVFGGMCFQMLTVLIVPVCWVLCRRRKVNV